MKKLFSIIFLFTILFLTSCGSQDNQGVITDQTKEENIIINGINDGNSFKKATISDDKSNEATEEVDTTSTGESATVTTFGSGESDGIGTDN